MGSVFCCADLSFADTNGLADEIIFSDRFMGNFNDCFWNDAHFGAVLGDAGVVCSDRLGASQCGL